MFVESAKVLPFDFFANIGKSKGCAAFKSWRFPKTFEGRSHRDRCTIKVALKL